MSAAIAFAITPYGGVHTYLSCKQAYFLNPLVSSSVPCRNFNQTQDSTDLPSELLRERGLYFLWSLPPHTRPRNRHMPEGKCRSFISGYLYTHLLPIIHIAVYTYRCIYSYTDIRLHTLHLRCLFYIHLYLSFHFRF